MGINTNGSLRSKDYWQRLGKLGVDIGFAIDGLADTHHLYRQDTDWHKIIENAGYFIEAGGRATWRFIPFDHNRHQEDACRKLAESMGFVAFENIYDGRDRGPVFDRNGRFSHHIGRLGPTEHPEPPKWNDWLQDHITWYDSNKIKHPKDVANIEMKCIHKMNREIYLAADGTVYPCCYLGFYPQTMTHPGNKELQKIVIGNNALDVGLEQAMSWFNRVEDSWDRASIRQGRTYQCVVTCGQPRS